MGGGKVGGGHKKGGGGGGIDGRIIVFVIVKIYGDSNTRGVEGKGAKDGRQWGRTATQLLLPGGDLNFLLDKGPTGKGPSLQLCVYVCVCVCVCVSVCVSDLQ